MRKILILPIIALLCAVLTAVADQQQDPQDKTGKVAAKSLALLAEEKFPEIDHVEIKGENPRLIYIPILHDNPEHSHAGGDVNKVIEEALVRSQKIAEHLYEVYGVRNILLEGLPKSLSDKYNSPEYRGRKLSADRNNAIIFRVWFDLLNKNQWHLVPAYDKETFGPLTLLGVEYTARIQKAFQTAKQNGWFRSYEEFSTNKTEFTDLIQKASKGYNERREALLKEDPGLKREYDITVIQRNKTFIDYTLAEKGAGIIMCGGGHIQDLINQFEKRDISYMIVVPKGSAWPPEKKDAENIYREMLKLGCQLSDCSITLGDGKQIQVKIPINK